jgi:hypothetical protein
VNTATTIGAALLGPAGWTYLLVSGSSGKENRCAKALEIAGRGTAGSKSNTGKENNLKTDSSENEQGLGDSILNFFKQHTLKGAKNEDGTDSR